jgi:AcrR family transcriptional regulator
LSVQKKYSEPEHRLLIALAKTVSVKGYAETNIADIVRMAGVSRRTFYENYQTKAQCFIELYTMLSLEGLAVLERSVAKHLPWQAQTKQVLQAYLEWMAQHPTMLRSLLIDILTLGAEGLRARREVHDKIVSSIQRICSTDALALPDAIASALVGGIHELILKEIEQGKEAQLASLTEVVSEFVLRTVAQAHQSVEGKHLY